MNKFGYLSTMLILICLLILGCEENDSISKNNNFLGKVNIVSPLNYSEFSQLDKILFQAELLSNGSTSEFDSIKWESNLIGMFSQSENWERRITSGNHIITCSIYKNNKEYSDQIEIFISDYVKVDTLFSNNVLEFYKIDDVDKYYTLNIDKNDNLILGTDGNGLIINDEGVWKGYHSENNLISNEIQSIGVDKENTIFIGYMFMNSISKKNGENWEHIEITGINQSTDSYYAMDVHNLAFDKNNVLWAALHYGEIVKYENDQWELINNQPVKFHHPSSLEFDNNNNLWGAGEFSSFKYNMESWELIEYNDDTLKIGALTVTDDGKVWANSLEGVYIISGSEINLIPRSTFSEYEIKHYRIAKDLNNNILFCSRKGIVKFDGVNWERLYYPGSMDIDIKQIAVDSKNNIWFCSQTMFGFYKAK